MSLFSSWQSLLSLSWPSLPWHIQLKRFKQSTQEKLSKTFLPRVTLPMMNTGAGAATAAVTAAAAATTAAVATTVAAATVGDTAEGTMEDTEVSCDVFILFLFLFDFNP